MSHSFLALWVTAACLTLAVIDATPSSGGFTMHSSADCEAHAIASVEDTAVEGLCVEYVQTAFANACEAGFAEDAPADQLQEDIARAYASSLTTVTTECKTEGDATGCAAASAFAEAKAETIGQVVAQSIAEGIAGCKCYYENSAAVCDGSPCTQETIETAVAARAFVDSTASVYVDLMARATTAIITEGCISGSKTASTSATAKCYGEAAAAITSKLTAYAVAFGGCDDPDADAFAAALADIKSEIEFSAVCTFMEKRYGWDTGFITADGFSIGTATGSDGQTGSVEHCFGTLCVPTP